MTNRDDFELNGMLREVPVLDPAGVRARIDGQNRLLVRLPDGTEHANVRVVPAFPITRPHRFLYFRDEEGNELGLLVDPRRLNRESRDLVLDQADQVYFMPRITRIIRVDEQTSGVATWEVETDRGWSRFEMVPRSESVWYVGRDRVLIRDVDGNRYLIEDTNALDSRSRRWSELYL
jgi:hypothetical protein